MVLCFLGEKKKKRGKIGKVSLTYDGSSAFVGEAEGDVHVWGEGVWAHKGLGVEDVWARHGYFFIFLLVMIV